MAYFLHNKNKTPHLSKPHNNLALITNEQIITPVLMEQHKYQQYNTPTQIILINKTNIYT
jgi:hypothetical protein